MAKYQSQLGYFKIEQTGDVFSYEQLEYSGTTISMSTINRLFGVSKPKLLCLCHPVMPIPMHFQRHRTDDPVAFFWDNKGNKVTHTPDCPRAKSDQVQEARESRRTLPGVEWQTHEDGSIAVDVNIDIFAADEEDVEIQEVSSSVDNSASRNPENMEEKSVRASRSTSGSVRGKSKFGGLMRTWYEVARNYAKENERDPKKQLIKSENLSMQNLLWAMMMVRFSQPNDRFVFTIRKKLAADFSFVPLKKAEPLRKTGEHKLVAGQLKWIREEAEFVKCGLEGVNATWEFRIPRHLTSGMSTSDIGKLAFLRGTYEREGFFLATHKPHFAFIVIPGAVWVDSSLEEKTYNELRKRHFDIEKPMRESDEFYGYIPDFVIRTHRLPVVIEVYGMRGNADYNKHKADKREVYKKAMEQRLIWYLEWDASVNGSWERFLRELDRLANATG